MGLPVVATPLGVEGLPIQDGENAVIAAGAAGLAAAIDRLLANDDERSRIGRAGRQLVERTYTWEASPPITSAYTTTSPGAPDLPVECRYGAAAASRVHHVALSEAVRDVRPLRDPRHRRARDRRGRLRACARVGASPSPRGRAPGRAGVLCRFASWPVLSAQWYWLRRRPRAYASAWWGAAHGNARSPRFLMRALAVVPLAATFARRMRAARVEHIHAHSATHPTLAAYVGNRLTGIP